jgi:hypothetical protein
MRLNAGIEVYPAGKRTARKTARGRNPPLRGERIMMNVTPNFRRFDDIWTKAVNGNCE